MQDSQKYKHPVLAKILASRSGSRGGQGRRVDQLLNHSPIRESNATGSLGDIADEAPFTSPNQSLKRLLRAGEILEVRLLKA